MAVRAVGRAGAESVPVLGHCAVVLAVAPATCGNRVALCLQERQREPETQQREQQTGGDPSHEQVDFTTSQIGVMSLEEFAGLSQVTIAEQEILCAT